MNLSRLDINSIVDLAMKMINQSEHLPSPGALEKNLRQQTPLSTTRKYDGRDKNK